MCSFPAALIGWKVLDWLSVNAILSVCNGASFAVCILSSQTWSLLSSSFVAFAKLQGCCFVHGLAGGVSSWSKLRATWIWGFRTRQFVNTCQAQFKVALETEARDLANRHRLRNLQLTHPESLLSPENYLSVCPLSSSTSSKTPSPEWKEDRETRKRHHGDQLDELLRFVSSWQVHIAGLLTFRHYTAVERRNPLLATECIEMANGNDF